MSGDAKALNELNKIKTYKKFSMINSIPSIGAIDIVMGIGQAYEISNPSKDTRKSFENLLRWYKVVLSEKEHWGTPRTTSWANLNGALQSYLYQIGASDSLRGWLNRELSIKEVNGTSTVEYLNK